MKYLYFLHIRICSISLIKEGFNDDTDYECEVYVIKMNTMNCGSVYFTLILMQIVDIMDTNQEINGHYPDLFCSLKTVSLIF